jgi:Zn-finger nucleic acid-binding protein
MEPAMSSLRCAMCRVDLAVTPHQGTEAWVCPVGHGLALTPSSAPAAEEALTGVWARAEAAAPGIRHCPRCDGDMAVVSLGAVKADACALCEVLWLDRLELTGLPEGQPDGEELLARARQLLTSSDQMQPAL